MRRRLAAGPVALTFAILAIGTHSLATPPAPSSRARDRVIRPSDGQAAAPRPGAVAESEPGLPEVLRRAGQAVVRQARESAVILGEETCRQSAYEETGTGRGATSTRTARRRWKAELALVQIPFSAAPGVPWLEIRDVVEVDGKRLPDREARLERMTRADPVWTAARARGIVQENARFNLGPVERTINAPTVPLLVLHPANQPRFGFTRAGGQRMGAVAAWKVAFREERRPTLVRAVESGADMPAAGNFWIDPASGDVLRAEMECGVFGESRVTVNYERHPKYGLSLPVEMSEKAAGNGGTWVEGRCRYSNFRRFETSARLVVPK